MKSKIILSTIIGFLAISFLSPSAWAESDHDRKHHGPGWIQELDLSEDQKESIKSIRKEFKPKMKSLREKIKSKKKSMESSLQSDTSENNLRKIFEEIQQLKSEKGKLRFEQTLKIRNILTPEQRKKFKSFNRSKYRRHHDRQR